jgi:molybdenum cofactor cytidylyltransferase
MPDPEPLRFGAVILAAGGSSRMGTPKQLLDREGLPLIAHIVDEVLGSGANPVVVVLGAEEKAIRAVISEKPVLVASNPSWSSGLAGSIRVGLKAVIDADSAVRAVLLTPCDQPALSSEIILRLASAHAATGRIACSRFNGRNASPAVFGRDAFAALDGLRGDRGARDLLNGDQACVEAIETPSLGLDLDTAADVERWKA